MTLQRPMLPPPAAERARPVVEISTTADQPANLPNDSTLPKPQKRPAKRRRRSARRRKGSYYPANITLDEFFKAYYALPPVESESKPSGEEMRQLAYLPSSPVRGSNGRSDPTVSGQLSNGPRQIPFPALEALARLRDEAAAEIDRLMAFLDATEPDVDLEPSMGPQNALDECEPDDCDNEDGRDDEPSLGFLQRYPNGRYGGQYWDTGVTRDFTGSQEGLCQGLGDDLEEEHDGGEPDVEGEPSLGSIEAIDQEYAWCFTTHAVDMEADPSDSGIADFDGLLEQCGPRRVPHRGVQRVA